MVMESWVAPQGTHSTNTRNVRLILASPRAMYKLTINWYKIVINITVGVYMPSNNVKIVIQSCQINIKRFL